MVPFSADPPPSHLAIAGRPVHSPAMPCVHLEGVPEDLHETLQQLARRQHESVSQIAVAILRRALLNPRARQGVLFPRPARIRAAEPRDES